MKILIFRSLLLHISQKTEKREQMQQANQPIQANPCLIFDQVYLHLSDGTLPLSDQYVDYFCVEPHLVYVAFADDFGPLNLGSIFRFCHALDDRIQQELARKLILHSSKDIETVTNTVFLVGAYLIMRRDYTVDQVVTACLGIVSDIAAYRDVSPGVQTFFLRVQDCWGGLWRAKALQWVDFGADGFDVDEYDNYDCPLNADLHEIIPGKLIAMRGPQHLPDGARYQDVTGSDGCFSHRVFSPAHCAEILLQFDVQAVVRLNAPHYDAQDMEAEGIAVAELYFEDCTPPPVDVVAKFLAITETVPGAVAVHCKAGLGRTGTLIALYMMKHHAFTAREAMGWLRIVRPGSVIGPQQDFLCAREALMRRSVGCLLPGPAELPPGAGVAEVASAIRDIIAGYDARYSAALRALAPRSAPAPRLSLAGPPTDEGLAAHVSQAADRRTGARARAAQGAVRRRQSTSGAGPGKGKGAAEVAALRVCSI